ncbi:hypothetical protein Tco_0852380 [Tanacetum coccineum]
MSKIEFPKFNGDDVKGRIFRCKHFFRINNVQEEIKTELATMHMYDRALVWHQQFVRRYGERCTLELYENEVLKRFGAVFEDHMVELKNLKQTGTMRNEISMPIRMFKLTTLVDAFCMAKMQEPTNDAMRSRYTPVQSNCKPNNVGNGYIGTGLLPMPVNTPLAFPTPNQINNDASSPGHKCSGQVYSLEVVGESEVQDEYVSEESIEKNEETKNVEMCNAPFDTCVQGP